MKQLFKECSRVPIDCMKCDIDGNPQSADCIYGQPIVTNCNVSEFTKCKVRIFAYVFIFYYVKVFFMKWKGTRSFTLNGICRFCYQTPEW